MRIMGKKKGVVVAGMAVMLVMLMWVFVCGRVCAATMTDADGFTYDADTGVLSGYSGTGENITIPAEVTTIQSSVFSGNTNISSVNLNNTQIIEAYAFRGAANLSFVSGGSSVIQIGVQAFANTNLSSFSISSDLAVLAQNAFSGTNISGFNVDSDNNGTYRVYGSSIYSDDGKTLFIVPEGYTENVVVSENATKIASGALSGAKQVTDIYIPASVTTIEDGATTGSGVTASAGEDGGTIYGYTGTVAETYANNHSIRFVSLNSTDNNNNNSSSSNGSSSSSSGTSSGGSSVIIIRHDDDTDGDCQCDKENTNNSATSTNNPPTATPTNTSTPPATSASASPAKASSPSPTSSGGTGTTVARRSSSYDDDDDDDDDSDEDDEPTLNKVRWWGTDKSTFYWREGGKADGYTLQYSTDPRFKKTKTKSVSSKQKKVTVTDIEKNKKYYVRVRAYETIGGDKYWSSWSHRIIVKRKR